MSSTRIDIEVIGTSAVQKHRVAASATRFYAGEPLIILPSYDNDGLADVNTVVQVTDATPVIGTTTFVGVAAQDAPVGTDTTVDADWVDVTEVIANFTRMRGKGNVAASCDSLSELVGLLWDLTLFDFNNTVSATCLIDVSASADTSGLTIKGGIWEKGLIDVTVDPRALRVDVT